MSGYYERTHAVNTDGSPTFATASDISAQKAVARMLEDAWGPNVTISAFPRLHVIDFYAERDGRVSALLELKCRSHESSAYPTVFLNMRKWIALLWHAGMLGIAPLFVVRFTDCVMWCDVREVDARQHRIGGTKILVKSSSDIEPVIEVPVSQMKAVCFAPSDKQ
jgi:hypothetical protein